MDMLTGWTIAAIIAKTITYAGGLGAAGSVLFVGFGGERLLAVTIQKVRSVTQIAAILALLTTALGVLLNAGELLDDGLSGMIDPGVIRLLLEGSNGAATLARIIGIILILITASTAFQRMWPGYLGALSVVLSLSMIGHIAKEGSFLLSGFLAFHLLAASYWIGALLPLYSMMQNRAEKHTAAKAAEDFGKRAVFIVAALIIAGLWMASTLVTTIDALYTTAYGLTLLAKIAFVASLLGFAALNKLRLVPAIARGNEAARTRLQVSIRLEMILFGFIFLATAILTTASELPHAH